MRCLAGSLKYKTHRRTLLRQASSSTGSAQASCGSRVPDDCGATTFVGLIWTHAGSQPGHKIPASGGSRSTRKDTKGGAFEFRRAPEETRG